jgi:hypothetical protein
MPSLRPTAEEGPLLAVCPSHPIVGDYNIKRISINDSVEIAGLEIIVQKTTFPAPTKSTIST